MVDKILEVPAILSTTYLSLNDQKTTLTGLYAQSVYNIAWLNESLPPFMDRQGMLAPFSLADNLTTETNETWTANTRFYSVDIDCEETGRNMSSSWGCIYDNNYMNLDASLLKKYQYSTMYVGYWYEESMDSYLKGQCPQEANRTFLVRWLSGETEGPVDQSQPQNINTTLWCRPFYCEFNTGAFPLTHALYYGQLTRFTHRSARSQSYCCSTENACHGHRANWSKAATSRGFNQHH